MYQYLETTITTYIMTIINVLPSWYYVKSLLRGWDISIAQQSPYLNILSQVPNPIHTIYTQVNEKKCNNKYVPCHVKRLQRIQFWLESCIVYLLVFNHALLLMRKKTFYRDSNSFQLSTINIHIILSWSFNAQLSEIIHL